jgi:hypothetical protein
MYMCTACTQVRAEANRTGLHTKIHNLNLLKLRKIWGFIVSMAFQLKEMQPLSIKYFVLIYGACEETILLLSDH